MGTPPKNSIEAWPMVSPAEKWSWRTRVKDRQVPIKRSAAMLLHVGGEPLVQSRFADVLWEAAIFRVYLIHLIRNAILLMGYRYRQTSSSHRR